MGYQLPLATSLLVHPHILHAAPVPFVHALHCIPNDAPCVFVCASLWSSGFQQLCTAVEVCVSLCDCVCVLRGRKEAMSHSTHTTRTQQHPLLLGQGKPRQCGCIVWKNRADRDIIRRLSPTPVSRKGRGGEEEGRGQQVEAVVLSFGQFFFSFLSLHATLHDYCWRRLTIHSFLSCDNTLITASIISY